jgi:hypothetical protein
MTEPSPRWEPPPEDAVLQGRDETTPVRALSRVWLVVAAVAAVVIGIAFGLWAALS